MFKTKMIIQKCFFKTITDIVKNKNIENENKIIIILL